MTIEPRVTPNNISYANYPQLSFFIMKPTANNPYIVWTLSYLDPAERLGLLQQIAAADGNGPFKQVVKEYTDGAAFDWLAGPLASYDFDPGDENKGYLGVNFTIDSVSGLVTNYLIDFQNPSNWTQYMFGSYSPVKYTITNRLYTAEDTTASISVLKALAGRDLADGEFSFGLYNADSEGVLGTLVETVMNVGTAVDFSPITYSDDDLMVEDNSKTYYYIIKENGDSLPGVTYDPMQIKVNVVVTDNGLGQMEATVNYPTDIEFNNVYTATGSFAPQVTKVLSGRDLADGEFEFVFREGATVLQTKTSAADGSIPFEAILYTLADVGAHTYTITETIGSLGGVSYDDEVVTFVVTVADNGDGTLKVEYELPFDTTFSNVYTTEDTSLVLEATKTLTGDKLLEDQEFSFELYKGTELVATAKNSADGKISFAPIVYKQSDIGVHNYTVKEVNTGLEGVTFDAHVFAVEVTVVDNGDGTLTATAKYPEGGIHFTNHFTPLPITHNVPVEKRVTGAGAPTDAKFYFELKAITPNAPMPAGAVNGLKTYTMTGAGSFELGLMSFTKEGTYVYELREQPTDAKNFTIDTTLYTITIKITREGYKLVKAAVFTKNNGTEPLEKLVYTNTYKAPPPPIPRTGEQDGAAPLAAMLFAGAVLTSVAKKKRGAAQK